MERYPVAPEDFQGKFVAFLSGTRADFGKLKPLIRKIYDREDIYCEIIAAGMHMLRRYGTTINEIHKAGFDRVFPLFNQDSLTSSKMEVALANTIIQLSHYISERKPDLLVVHGDRVETLAGVITANLNNILVAHVEGGEVSGTADESMRHAISKLAHIHFVANQEAKTRLLQLGEYEDSIFVIGSPEVDIMTDGSLPSLEEAKKYYEISFDSYALFSYHPVTTELGDLERYSDAIFSAIKQSDHNFVIVEPNNDLGSDVIRRFIERLSSLERVKVYSSIRFEYYLSLLKGARYIIGNSSSGVREAPVFGVPCINIGSRQNNRAKNEAIFNVNEDSDEILEVINSLPNRFSPVLTFGAGNAAENFLNTVRNDRFWEIDCQKSFIDRELLDYGSRIHDKDTKNTAQ
jgi:UDP-N-acetylglucosamine 2-epimerase (hydrolysing)